MWNNRFGTASVRQWAAPALVLEAFFVTSQWNIQQPMHWSTYFNDLFGNIRNKHSSRASDRCWHILVGSYSLVWTFQRWDRGFMELDYCDRGWLPWDQLWYSREDSPYVMVYKWISQKQVKAKWPAMSNHVWRHSTSIRTWSIIVPMDGKWLCGGCSKSLFVSTVYGTVPLRNYRDGID